MSNGEPMNTRTKITSMMGGAAMVATVAGMTAGLAPASAAPSQSPESHLTIVDQNVTGAGKNRVIVQGVYPMQKPDAVGFSQQPERRLRRHALHRLGRRRR